LVGSQKEVIDLIFNECVLTGSLITPPITIEYILKNRNLAKNTVRKTIQRLEKKGFISREKFKNGRGGWTQYKLQKII
jgi:predicted transcriptional regulator